ncbi:1-acylglycerol-3-phosphate O-acyltransferase [Colwellia psychrerythraea]|uniref:1-acyl-sn-glycerol-3-phosphate acyltransferase n=1 Tax=Colwellia psychrerythraea TaxID=28229 RepID=A0A099KJI8_COLPS|nr:1-acylglycerol-3-phosphate O-acyltransferase [Colwellia psychrerythraea]KGJ90430.1 1-acyl-sn-glycerol-3-phosphate acyltransferase [Colwellia psychrerythraea]
MLAVIRVFLMTLALVIICTISIFYCLLRPFHRNNVYHTSRFLGKIPKLLGVDVEVRIPDSVKGIGPVVWAANHQNSYDLFTHANAVLPGTVSVGKKSLKWIPFFGQMYWLTGNILIDRKNTNKAMSTIDLTADKIKKDKLSVWMFPEGTRSRGRGLLPLKTGAFRTAIQAGVPIVPICASNQHGTINLNRWDNGKIIIEFLDPVELKDIDREHLRNTVNDVHKSMYNKIEQLSAEAAAYHNK